MKLKKVSCFDVSRFRVLAEDFFALTVSAYEPSARIGLLSPIQYLSVILIDIYYLLDTRKSFLSSSICLSESTTLSRRL